MRYTNLAMKLSVVIATYNEEENIGPCLAAVKDLVDEMVVVDGESQDRTRDIARSSKARVIETTNKPIFHLNKQLGVDQAFGDWILQLDADERVTPELAAEIKAVINQKPKAKDQALPVAYWLKRRNLFLGRFLTKGGVYPDPVIRLFQKGKAYLPCRSVHEQFEVKGRVGWLEHDLIHLADPSFSRYLKRFNRYTSLLAQELIDAKASLGPVSWLRYFVFEPGRWFLLTYLRHQGFRDGFPGLVFSGFSSLRFPVAYIKYWELAAQAKKDINLKSDWA